MNSSTAPLGQKPLERQLLSQLGGRLKAARETKKISAVELSRQVGISRTTLQAVEQGLPSPSMGTYLTVMAALGFAADLALLATGEASAIDPAPPQYLERHGAQDYQSLLMHVAAVQLLKLDPSLIGKAVATLSRWRVTADPRSYPLLDEWKRILKRKDWSLAIAQSEHGNQLRQASPLATLLPQETRLEIIRKVKALKEVVYAAEPA